MEERKIEKWVCPVCGYVHEEPEASAEYPICHIKGEKFNRLYNPLTGIMNLQIDFYLWYLLFHP